MGICSKELGNRLLLVRSFVHQFFSFTFNTEIRMKRKLALDCDGVLCDFVGPYLKGYNELMNTSFTPEDITEWNFFKLLNMNFDDVNKVVCQKHFVYSMPMLRPDLPELIKDLQEVFDVYVVTAPWDSSPFWEFERKEWLSDFLNIPKNKVVSTHSKHLIQADIFVDDAPKNFIDSLATTKMLFDSPYNQECDNSIITGRMYDLEECFNIST
jgi:5'-nucleotidase